MPVLIEEEPKIRNDDKIVHNIRLRLLTEKVMEKTQDIIMFFQVLYVAPNNPLFTLMEELETDEPTAIMPFFRGQRDYILKINKKWLLAGDNPLEIQQSYKLNIMFRKYNINGKKGYYIRELPEKQQQQQQQPEAPKDSE